MMVVGSGGEVGVNMSRCVSEKDIEEERIFSKWRKEFDSNYSQI